LDYHFSFMLRKKATNEKAAFSGGILKETF
jgi:hypothetical protein